MHSRGFFMAAKKLTLVASDPPGTLAPPRQLGEHGLALWRSVTAEYGIEDAGGIELLSQACQAVDMAERCRAEIDRDGPVLRLKGGALKDHPALKHELGYRAFVTRCIARFGLDVEAVKPIGRPSGYGS
jgi:hypothetical protein